MTTTLVPILEHKIPEYVRESYPNFVNFIKDYLTFLEQDEGFLRIIQDWQQNHETSNDVEPYITAILKDLGFESGQNLEVKKSLLIHQLRDFYLARGSEGSFKFLFRALFNEDVDVRYPREQMLIPSHAAYGSRHFIFTTAERRDDVIFEDLVLNIIENSGSMSGISSGALAAIESISIIYGDSTPYLQIEVLRPAIDFNVGEQVIIQSGSFTIAEEIKPALDIRIVAAGSGYAVGDQIHVTSAAIQGSARVSHVSGGGVEEVNIISAGTGYSVGDRVYAQSLDDGFGFSAFVSSVDTGGEILNIEVTHHGYNYRTLPTLSIKGEGAGAEIEGLSGSIGSIIHVEATHPFVDFEDPGLSVESENGQGANLIPIELSRWETSAWESRRGFIGESSTLIDSDKYQQFSYTLVSSIPAGQFNSFVDELLHPAGFIRSNSFEIVSDLLLDSISSDYDSTVTVAYEWNHDLELLLELGYELQTNQVNIIVDDQGEDIIDDDNSQLLAVF